MPSFWQRMDKRQRLLTMAPLVAILLVAVILRYGAVPVGDLPTGNNLRKTEQNLRRLRLRLEESRDQRAQDETQLRELRRLALPFTLGQRAPTPADVDSELDRLRRRAQVKVQRLRQVGDNTPISYAGLEYIQKLEYDIEVLGSMRDISRLLAEVEEAQISFAWQSCTIRPDNIRDPREVRLNGRIEALMLSPEAAESLFGPAVEVVSSP